MDSKYRLSVFISHPIQHFSPLFREISKKIDIQVNYYSDFGQNFYNFDPGFSAYVKWDIPLLAGYEYQILKPFYGNSIQKLHSCVLNRGIFQSIKSYHPDAILLFGYSFLSDWVVWIISKSLKIPLMLISDSELVHRRTIIKELIKFLPVSLFLRGISAFMSAGDNNSNYARHYGLGEQKIFASALPVEINRFQKRARSKDTSAHLRNLKKKLDIQEKSKIILFCGKLIPSKRPLDLVKAIIDLSWEPIIIALFIGDGVLKDEVINLGREKVRVTGFINQNELPDYLLLGDLLVQPSERDPHPLVITEAASMGIPSIVSDRVGCIGDNDIIRPGKTGLIYKCGDIEELQNCIINLLSNNNLRRVLGEGAKIAALSQDPSNVADNIIGALASIVKE